MNRTTWRKSSYSGGGGQNCVEVADTSEFAAVRDTSHRELGHLAFTRAEFAAFLTDVKTRAL